MGFFWVFMYMNNIHAKIGKMLIPKEGNNSAMKAQQTVCLSKLFLSFLG